MKNTLLQYYYINMKLINIDRNRYLRKIGKLLNKICKLLFRIGLTNQELVLVNAKQSVCCEISNRCWRTLDISRNHLWTRSQTI